MSRPKHPEWKQIKNFPIGTKVMVSAKLESVTGIEYDYSMAFATSRTWRSAPCQPFVAWVSGARWYCNGVLVVDHASASVGKSQRRLKVTEKVPALLVRRFQFGTEIAVPVTAVEEIPLQLTAPGLSISEAAPMAVGISPKDEAKAAQADRAKAMPRTTDGRFVPTKKAEPKQVEHKALICNTFGPFNPL